MTALREIMAQGRQGPWGLVMEYAQAPIVADEPRYRHIVEWLQLIYSDAVSRLWRWARQSYVHGRFWQEPLPQP